MKNLEVQAREKDGAGWYPQFIRSVEEAGYDRNVGNMWPNTQKDAVLPTKLEDAMRNDTICGWTTIYNQEYEKK